MYSANDIFPPIADDSPLRSTERWGGGHGGIGSARSRSFEVLEKSLGGAGRCNDDSRKRCAKAAAKRGVHSFVYRIKFARAPLADGGPAAISAGLD
jgi:hypothetical protein